MKVKDLIETYGEYEIKDPEKVKEMLVKPKPKTVNDLVEGDECWRISPNFQAPLCETWKNNSLYFRMSKIGDIFLTEEECREEIAFRIMRKKLKDAADGYNFKVGQQNYFLKPCYNNETQELELRIDWSWYDIYSEFYFESAEKAQDAIEKIGEKELLKYYFKIKEVKE